MSEGRGVEITTEEFLPWPRPHLRLPGKSQEEQETALKMFSTISKEPKIPNADKILREDKRARIEKTRTRTRTQTHVPSITNHEKMRVAASTKHTSIESEEAPWRALGRAFCRRIFGDAPLKNRSRQFRETANYCRRLAQGEGGF